MALSGIGGNGFPSGFGAQGAGFGDTFSKGGSGQRIGDDTKLDQLGPEAGKLSEMLGLKKGATVKDLKAALFDVMAKAIASMMGGRQGAGAQGGCGDAAGYGPKNQAGQGAGDQGVKTANKDVKDLLAALGGDEDGNVDPQQVSDAAKKLAKSSGQLAQNDKGDAPKGPAYVPSNSNNASPYASASLTLSFG